jgi:predicted TPR repeat methyltransferase
MSTSEDDVRKASMALQNGNWIDAEAHARSALRNQPTNAAALCVLASVHFDRGDDAEAFRLFRSAIACQPGFGGSYRALVRTYYSLGRIAEAAEILAEWSKIDADPEVQYMAAAMNGKPIAEPCSKEYVQVHFDRFASVFDATLVTKLSYRGPELIANSISRHRNANQRFFEAGLDAGCGTGLCGASLRPYCRTLVGVDISENMAHLARERGCYDDVVVSEICTFMETSTRAFDLIASSDVFVYFGGLDRVVAAAAGCLRSEGILVFTVEALDSDNAQPYRLGVSGRYAHAEPYLLKLLSDCGFEVLRIEQDTLRWECLQKVLCHVVIARNAS